MAKNEWIKQEGSQLWLPTEEGAELIGKVTAISEGNYGMQYTIEQENGEELRTPSHRVLQNRMANVKEGDNIKIVYKGEEPPSVKGQNPLKMYEVYKKE